MLKEHGTLQEQVTKTTTTQFSPKIMKCIKRLLMKKCNSYFNDHILLAQEQNNVWGVRITYIYYPRKTLSVLIICVLHQENLSNNFKTVINLRFYNMSGIGISDVLMNLMSYIFCKGTKVQWYWHAVTHLFHIISLEVFSFLKHKRVL